MSASGQRTTKHPPKTCSSCGKQFWKISSYSAAQWEKAHYCSNKCRARARWKPYQDFRDGGRWIVRRPSDGKRVYRARLVMEQAIGRKLRPEEVVHHINRDCTDDRLENLQLYGSHSEHMKDHCRNGDLPQMTEYMP
jgi:hypothetical protein